MRTTLPVKPKPSQTDRVAHMLQVGGWVRICSWVGGGREVLYDESRRLDVWVNGSMDRRQGGGMREVADVPTQHCSDDRKKPLPPVCLPPPAPIRASSYPKHQVPPDSPLALLPISPMSSQDPPLKKGFKLAHVAPAPYSMFLTEPHVEAGPGGVGLRDTKVGTKGGIGIWASGRRGPTLHQSR